MTMATQDDAASSSPPLQPLFRGLASLDLSLSGKRVLETVNRGRMAYARIRTTSGGSFCSLQEIVDFSWFLVAAAASKNQQFTSGMFVFEDPEHRVFDALSKFGYSRVLSSVKNIVNEKKAFGSSHFIDFIQWSRQRGPWYVPEETKGVPPSPSPPSPPPSPPSPPSPPATKENRTGYEQVGVDLRKRLLNGASKSVTSESCKHLGVYLTRRHLLSGLLPKKITSEKRQYTFCKLETHGTKRKTEALGHAMSFLKTRRDVGRCTPSSSVSRSSPSSSVVNTSEESVRENDKDVSLVKDSTEDVVQDVVQRKEHPPLNALKLFHEILTIIHEECSTIYFKTPLYDSNLTRTEISLRSKILGLSFMNTIVVAVSKSIQRLQRRQQQQQQQSLPTRLGEAVSEWEDLINIFSFDHMDVRFGQEVIFSIEELATFGYSVATNCDDNNNNNGRRSVSSSLSVSSSKLLEMTSSLIRSKRTSSSFKRGAETETTCAGHIAAMVVAFVAVTLCVAHCLGLSLACRRALGWSPEWFMAITHVVVWGSLAWSCVLTLFLFVRLWWQARVH